MNNLEIQLAMIESEIKKSILKKENIDKYLADLLEIKQELTDELYENNMPCKRCNHA